MNVKTSLKHRGEPLASAAHQLTVLQPASDASRFAQRLLAAGHPRLEASTIEILQVNLGKLCNMTCEHCHVDAGPDRREIMQRPEIDACLRVLRENPAIGTLDLTGGAPEMNPHFRDMVVAARQSGRHVIDRCNLTILLARGYEDLPQFLAANQVEIVASLPCYLAENADAQRGDGSFARSVKALQLLNSLGYGVPDSDRILTLVYNPVGPSLPPGQAELESDYRRELLSRHGIRFNRLFTITNMPVSRFLEYLLRTGEYHRYMQRLIDAFNPSAINGLMCRNTLSVGWDGKLYDCDFNQMLEMQLQSPLPVSIHEFDFAAIQNRAIRLGQHCFGCTAGAGSGCQGAISS